MSFSKPAFSAAKLPDAAHTSAQCKAHGCKMPPGIVIAGQTVCAWHHGANISDFHRITGVINDWNVVSREILIGRRILCDQVIGTKPAAIDDAFGHAVGRVEHVFGEWPELAPGATKGGHFDDYRSWIDRLSRFLTVRTTEVMRKAAPAKANTATKVDASVWDRVEKLMVA